MRTSNPDHRHKTRQRILKKSLSLFNKNGVRNVSAHSIAKELGVSVGNVTYHFAKKTDIINGLSEQLQEDMVAALDSAKHIDGEGVDIARSVLQFVGLFWEYRFFFNDLMYLTKSDPAQRKRYFVLKDMAVGALCQAHLYFEEKGAAKPIKAPNTLEWTMENLWYFWINFLRTFLIETPASKAQKKRYIDFAALHMYSFLEPYYTDQVRAGIYDYITGNSR